VLSLFVLALGEIIQAAVLRVISRLAPPGEQGTYMALLFCHRIGSLIVAGLAARWSTIREVTHQPRASGGR